MTSRPPRISVCLAAYNAQDTLPRVLESILAQDDGDFELLAVDDASTDGTPEILAACRDPRLRVMRSSANVGQARALNLAIAGAQGRYVKFCDSDDPLEPACLRRLADVAQADPRVSLVFCRRHIRVEGERHAGIEWWLREYANPAAKFERLDTINDGGRLLDEYIAAGFRGNWFCEPAGLLARRASLERVGGLNPRIRQVPDLDLCLRLLTAGAAGFVDEALYTYVLGRAGSISSTVGAADAQWLDYLWMLAALREIPGVWAAHPGLRAAQRRHRRSTARVFAGHLRAGNRVPARIADLAAYVRASAALAVGRRAPVVPAIGPPATP